MWPVCGSSLVPSPSHPSFYLAVLFLHGCEIKAGVGRTGNEAIWPVLVPVKITDYCTISPCTVMCWDLGDEVVLFLLSHVHTSIHTHTHYMHTHTHVYSDLEQASHFCALPDDQGQTHCCHHHFCEGTHFHRRWRTVSGLSSTVQGGVLPLT